MSLMLSTEQDILTLIEADSWMMDILKIVQSLNLPDCWVCAGFVRTKVWDTLHSHSVNSPLADIDVVYFDKNNIKEEEEKRLENRLRSILPREPWSVKNQARMHVVNGDKPYESTVDAISRFPETATSIAVKLDQHNELILATPWGIDDLLSLQIKPTPPFTMKKELVDIYESRLQQKDWESKWSKVKVYSFYASRES